MLKIEKEIEIKAGAERIFDYITDPNNLPAIWPSMVGVSNVERRTDGWHRFDWVYKMVGVHFRGHADTIAVDRPRFLQTKSEAGIASKFTWQFTARGSACEVKLGVEYTIPTPVIGRLAEHIVARMNEREAETLLLNLKTAVEALALEDFRPQVHA